MVRSSSALENTYDPDAAAAAGAAFLDGRRLSTTTLWRSVDPDLLDMGSNNRDLLTLLGTSYAQLSLTLNRAVALGFEPVIDDYDHADALTAAWLRLLAANEIAEVA
jgi:hypothetical protein